MKPTELDSSIDDCRIIPLHLLCLPSQTMLRDLPRKSRYRSDFDARRNHLSQVLLFLSCFFLHESDPSLVNLDVPALAVWLYVPVGFWIFERLARMLQLVSISLLAKLQFRSPFIKARATLIEGAVVLRVPFKGKWEGE